MLECIIWIIAFIVFVIAEAVTDALVSVWFVLGSLGGLLAAATGKAPLVQLMIFVLVSIISLLLTRPLLKKFLKRSIVPTNYDRIIGRECEADEDITAISGSIRIDGNVWTARSMYGNTICSGSIVIIDHIEGVKAMVIKK